MSRFFRKSKKTFAVLLTIAFVLSLAAVPVFAGTTYSTLTAPTVPDDDGQKLGTISIEVDPIVDPEHEAWIEVEDGWNIEEITITKVSINDGATVFETGDPLPTANVKVNDSTTDIEVGDPIVIDDDSFTLWVNTPAAWNDLEVWLEFTKVDVDDTGPIRAYITGLQGQLIDGDVLIGRGQAGELLLSVREYDYFSDEGNVEIRVVEDVYQTFNDTDKMTLRLPRGFEWNEDLNWSANTVFGNLAEADVTVEPEGRDLDITFSAVSRRSAIDLILGDAAELAIQVVDPARAQKGEIIAEVKGDYDTVPDELMVGVYGDYEYTVTPEAAETVYAGRVEQEIADFTIEEDIAGTFVEGRSVTLLLPSWAKWGDLPDEVDDGDVTLELRLFYGRDGREAVYRVTSAPDDDPRELEFEDMEVILAPNAPVGEDLVVSIAGSAGVRGDVVVGTVAAPATMDVDPVNVIGIGRSNQVIGRITITEAEAGMFKEDKAIHLMTDTDVTWAAGITVEVLEGDIELGTATGAGSRTLSIRVDTESDEASTIQITGSVTTLRTVPEGDSLVRLRGPAVVETQDFDALDDQYGWVTGDGDWYQIDGKDVVRRDNVWPDLANAVVKVLADVGVPAPPIEEPDPATVMMWIGSTTYTVNGVEGEMDVAPFIENDRTFVPVRFIAEALGAEAAWGPEDGLTEWVTLTKGDMVVMLTIGSNIITVTDGDETYTVMSDVAAQIINDRTFLPARAVGEIFGAQFDWGPKEALTAWVSFTL